MYTSCRFCNRVEYILQAILAQFSRSRKASGPRTEAEDALEKELANLGGDESDGEDDTAALNNVLDLPDDDGEETDEAREEADEDILKALEDEGEDTEAVAPTPTPAEIRTGKIALEKVRPRDSDPIVTPTDLS